MSVDLEKLAADREAATVDKADLFDFYDNNWDRLIAHIRELKSLKDQIVAMADAKDDDINQTCIELNAMDQY